MSPTVKLDSIAERTTSLPPFSLLSLPREIRQQILLLAIAPQIRPYEYNIGCSSFNARLAQCTRDLKKARRSTASLILVCKQLRTEIRDYVFVKAMKFLQEDVVRLESRKYERFPRIRVPSRYILEKVMVETGFYQRLVEEQMEALERGLKKLQEVKPLE
jgi:hypothetical protein